MENTESVIKYSGVNISLEKTILSNINLDLKKGEFVYLIGKTGSGKSSLLRSIYADITIETGSACVCGFTLNGLKKSKIPLLRRKLGIVFQDFQLLKDRTVYDNLAFVLKATGWKDKKAIKERILQALDDVGLLMKAYEQACDLSEGEMQRVSIARAIVNQPELILADEPTGNLDPITSEEIVQLLMKINQKHGTTVLMATHDYIVLDKFRAKILACEDGTIKS
ncbi:MAG: ATP-binding cassette domain-containing protein [Bacteroidales bacterium]|jgi:cell division transport system ATP-binding protein|nr:ATP-binding cassette domain-containing protein [Bacteroidales bacterium]